LIAKSFRGAARAARCTAAGAVKRNAQNTCVATARHLFRRAGDA
jgi:hypothetical protein